MPTVRVIGLHGLPGAGKDSVANLCPVPSARVGFADPLYEGLAVMLGLTVADLRDRRRKELPLPGIGKSPRELLETLGHEWGRELVYPRIWLDRGLARIRENIEMLTPSLNRRQATGVVWVTDVRYPEEAAAIREEFGGEVWHITRPGTTERRHPSGSLLSCDLTIENTGTTGDLAGTALRALFSGAAV